MLFQLCFILCSIFFRESFGDPCYTCVDFWPSMPLCPASNGDVRFFYNDAQINNTELTINTNTCMNKSITHVVIVASGWFECPQKAWCQILQKNLIAANPSVAVIQVDWRNGSNIENYLKSAGNAVEVGQNVAKFVVQHLKNVCGFKVDLQVTCVGCSLGAHVCGALGKQLKSMYNEILFGIVGAEPAAPGFQTAITTSPESLTGTDAKYVKVLHCSSILGRCSPIPNAVNFYLNNNNVNQPGCSFLELFKDFNLRTFLHLLATHNIIALIKYIPILDTTICGHLYCIVELVTAILEPLNATPCGSTPGGNIEFGNSTFFSTINEGTYSVLSNNTFANEIFAYNCKATVP